MRRLNKWLPNLLLVAVLLISMAGGAAYAKYVKEIELDKGTISITADLGKIEIWESPVTYEAKTGYTLGSPVQKSNSSYSYTLIPGLDIPKDPFVRITNKSVIEAYVFIEVDTNISSSDTGIKYTLDSCWKLVEGYSNVYVYCDEEGKPIAVTVNKEIPILAKDSEGKSYIYISQYLKQATDAENKNIYPSGKVYLNVTATMRQVVEGKSEKEIYEDITNY